MTVQTVPEPPAVEPARPWPVRVARWAPAVSGLLLVLLPAVGLLLPMLTHAGVRAAPSDPCGLVPADLLQRLVPAPGPTQRTTHDAGHTECTLSTERQQATDPYGSVWLDVERQGGAPLQRPAERAQDLHAGLKRVRMDGKGAVQYQIADVSGLGDDAYVSTEVGGGDGKARGYAMVVVLVGDTALTVTYTAAPSTDALATAAAVAVARAALGGLR